MKSQVLHTVWCNISCEDVGEMWNWSLLGVQLLKNVKSPTKVRSLYAEDENFSRIADSLVAISDPGTLSLLYQGATLSRIDTAEIRIWRHFRWSAEIRIWRHFRWSAEIRIWCHFHWSAFVAMDVQLSESRDKISPPSSIFLVHNLCCGKCI